MITTIDIALYIGFFMVAFGLSAMIFNGHQNAND
ncbi:hypothetical protein Hbal_2891 [Hirschia baltica ATCC 49814]|uniref:Uncharacterized protein n=1 Tax=Hirschia baltica (strain ATCC 49814 / DSM 5838 / IFAM 1418) TaxID=582402 RepID=C6XR31_HIRBI|nr:hypothetical protein Hbal_2891 [Hirschia baltica ATCC 49814]